MFSSSVVDHIKKYKESIKKINVSAKPLRKVFSEHCITKIKVLFIDVEGMELDVLESIDFDSVIIESICLENNSYDLYGDDIIRKFLISKNYTFIGRIGHLDDIYLLN